MFCTHSWLPEDETYWHWWSCGFSRSKLHFQNTCFFLANTMVFYKVKTTASQTLVRLSTLALRLHFPQLNALRSTHLFEVLYSLCNCSASSTHCMPNSTHTAVGTYSGHFEAEHPRGFESSVKFSNGWIPSPAVCGASEPRGNYFYSNKHNINNTIMRKTMSQLKPLKVSVLCM